MEALIDSAANQRTLASSKSVTELFFERGVAVNPHVNKDVFSGICRVKEYLKRDNGLPDIYIFDTCRNMIEEFCSYSWADGDTPVKRDDHCMDELRYFVTSRPRLAERKREIGEIEADKLRRIRRFNRLNGKRR